MAVVSHHRKVQERLVALDVRNPQTIRRIGLKLALDPVRSRTVAAVHTRGARTPAATHSG